MTALVVLASAAILALSWSNGLVDVMRETEGSGRLMTRLQDCNLVLAPVAVLLLAAVPGWAACGHRLRAIVASIPLPAWSAVLLLRETWLGNWAWGLIAVAPLMGIEPFGAP